MIIALLPNKLRKNQETNKELTKAFSKFLNIKSNLHQLSNRVLIRLTVDLEYFEVKVFLI